jgi:hypothetical protein
MDLQRAANVSQILSLVPGFYSAYAAWLSLRGSAASAAAGVWWPPVSDTGVLIAFGAFSALVVLGGILRLLSAKRSGTTPQRALTPLRVLERHYLALATLRDHVGRLRRQKEAGGTLSASACITIGLAVDKIRAELINMSPQLFTTSDALDFREKEPPIPPGTLVSEEPYLADTRVPRELDHLMKTLLRLWQGYGEAAGIAPLRFDDSPIVKLHDV